MLGRRPAIVLLALAAACATPPPPPPPAPAEPAWVGREPSSPPGTEGLRASPCSARIDLSASAAAARAFDPAARSLSGRTTLSFRVRGPARPWAWSSSRAGALRFEDAAAGSVTLLAGAPGATLVRLAVGDPGDPAADEATALVSVPLFVRVRGDRDFAGMFDRELGLGARTPEVMAEAKAAIYAIYAGVNLRVAFETGLGEALPASLPPGGFVEATMHGDLHGCVTPRSSLLNTEFGGYAEGEGGARLLLAPVHVCPAMFARHPDALAEMVKRRARLLAGERGAAVYTAAIGRALGEVLAHEIGHQLLGCDNRGERRTWRCHDRLPRSLMNKAGERSFADRTGITITPTQYSSIWREDFPAEGTYEDRGVVAINKLPPDGQAVLDRILPVPPALIEEMACP